MGTFLDELKPRWADAQKRLQVAQQELAAATAKVQALAQEFNSLQFLLNQETAKLQQQEKPALAMNASASVVPVAPTPISQSSDVNKTDMVRDLLCQHPTGMTPTEIWKEVKGQLRHRPYLYSILKRLKDKDEVFVRRKKYIAKIVPRSEAANGQTIQ